MPTNHAEVIASFTSSRLPEHFEPRSLVKACDAITDAVGVGIAGAVQPATQRAIDALMTLGDAAIIGRSERTDARSAALLNGLIIHALDFDDTAHPAYAHPSAVLIPTLFAADRVVTPIGGLRALRAYVVGVEVLNVLGQFTNPEHYLSGWHSTATLGTIAATAAASFAVGLDSERSVTALAIAASMASGVRANFGSMTKPLHAGLAARNASEAVLLASKDFTAQSEALGGEFGWLQATGSPLPDLHDLTEALGAPWEIDTDIGLALKPYPSCGATHPAIEAAASLRDEIDSTPTRIRVGVNALTPSILIYDRPRTGLESKFSMQYCVAAALHRGELSFQDFSDETREQVLSSEFYDIIDVVVDPRVEHDSEFATIIRIETETGSAFEKQVPQAKGKPQRWFDESTLWSKFIDCSKLNSAVNAERAWEACRSLLEDSTLRTLAESLHTDPPPN